MVLDSGRYQMCIRDRIRSGISVRVKSLNVS